jgi:hypothetical protein
MNFLADESCPGPVIRALREAGHHVVAIAETAKGSPDEQVMEHALKREVCAYYGRPRLWRYSLRARTALGRSDLRQVSQPDAGRQARGGGRGSS